MMTALDATWIQRSNPRLFTDDQSFSIIIDFFIIHSPCKYQSNRRFDISGIWGNSPWTVERHLKRPLAITLFGSPNPNLIKCKKNEIQLRFNEHHLGDDFDLNLDRQICIFSEAPNPGNSNQYMSLFYHIRNSLAHSRFAILNNSHEINMLVFEDGRRVSSTEFEVNARGILELNRLADAVRLLKAGPTNLPSIEEQILSLIASGEGRKRKIREHLNITDADWKVYITVLKKEGKVIHDKKNGWEIAH